MKYTLAALLIFGGLAVAAQSDVIAKLGSNAEEANEAVFSAFSGGSVSMAGTSEVFTK